MEKQLYKGSFNWYNELIILYTHAWSEKGAKSQFLSQLAIKLNREPCAMRKYFSGCKDNFKIKLINEQ